MAKRKKLTWFISDEGIDILTESIFLYRRICEDRFTLEQIEPDKEDHITHLKETEDFLRDRINIFVDMMFTSFKNF